MKHKIFKILVVGSFMLPILGWSISRIGGGKISSDRSYFQADLSIQFQKVETGNDVLQVYSTPTFSGVGGLSGKLLIAEFADIYPSLVDLSRSQMDQVFWGMGYRHVSDDFGAPDCVDIFYKSFEQNTQYVLAWGAGRGFQLTLTKDGQTQFEGQSLVKSLELFEGACAWK